MQERSAERQFAGLEATGNSTTFIFGYRLVADDSSSQKLHEVAADYHRHLASLDRASITPDYQWDGKSKPSPLWKLVARPEAMRALHPDLTPAVDRLLHGPGQPQACLYSTPFSGLPPLELNPGALTSSFWLNFGNAARTRLHAHGLTDSDLDGFGVECQKARLYTFASGIILLAITTRVVDIANSEGKVPLPCIEEANYLLAHAASGHSTLRTIDAEMRHCPNDLLEGSITVLDVEAKYSLRTATEAERANSTSDGPSKLRTLLRAVKGKPGKQLVLFGSEQGDIELRSLARALAGISLSSGVDAERSFEVSSDLRIDEVGPKEHGRVFSYCGVTVFAAMKREEAQDAVFRLGQRFTSHYSLDAGQVEHSVLRIFNNITHCMATQGGAVLVSDATTPFLEDYLKTAVMPAYLPLALLSYHEYLLLLHLSQECAFIPNTERPSEDKTRIEGLRYQLSKFRLYFRFSHVSDMHHHNKVHREWRKTLDLDAMLQELAADVREADAVLERYHQAEERKRWRLAGAVAALLGGFVAASHLFDQAHRSISKAGMETINEGLWGPPVLWLDKLEVVAFTLSLLIGIAFAIIAWRKGPKIGE